MCSLRDGCDLSVSDWGLHQVRVAHSSRWLGWELNKATVINIQSLSTWFQTAIASWASVQEP